MEKAYGLALSGTIYIMKFCNNLPRHSKVLEGGGGHKDSKAFPFVQFYLLKTS
jgi:hypothetical protein